MKTHEKRMQRRRRGRLLRLVSTFVESLRGEAQWAAPRLPGSCGPLSVPRSLDSGGAALGTAP